MEYNVIIHRNEEPEAVRFWAEIEGVEGCFIAENSLEALERTAEDIVTDFIRFANERGATYAEPTALVFRWVVPVT